VAKGKMGELKTGQRIGQGNASQIAKKKVPHPFQGKKMKKRSVSSQDPRPECAKGCQKRELKKTNNTL